MSKKDKYKEIFMNSLSIKDQNKVENLKYNEIDEWDSIGHMTLISNLEKKFKITIETDDIVDFSSFKKGKEILSKYKIKI